MLGGSYAHAGLTIKEHMNQYYSDIDDNKCRYKYSDDLKYCVKLAKAEAVNTTQGKRIYILMTGNTEDGGHPTPGIVGMFVFAPDVSDGQDNTWKVVSADANKALGSFGHAPSKWSFHQFAANTYGFTTEHGYTNMGESNSYYLLLTPHKSTILENTIPSGIFVDNLSFCSTGDNQCTDITGKLSINNKKSTNGFYQLSMILNGNIDNTKYRNKQYSISYKKGKGYVPSASYPISFQ